MVDVASIPSALAENRPVLVTGASGFIGTRLVRHLHADGVGIIAADIQPPRERLDGVVYQTWDVRKPAPQPLTRPLSRIYNLAAVHRTPGHPTHEYYETNVLGATNAVELAEHSGTNTMVFTSSISVYGPSEELLNEESLLKPVSAYGRSKRLAETIHQRWRTRSEKRKLIIVRPGVVFGPGERGNYTYLARALARGIFFYPGRQDTIKSGGYVDELLRTVEFALSQPDAEVVYNFAYPDHSTTADIVGAFSEVCGFKAHYTTLPVAPLYALAALFEFADGVGIRNPVHRERILKLVKSTRIEPSWLNSRGYEFQSDLHQALIAWKDETDGAFV